ncbi:hypothetical protein B4113_2232 [Geobacillus sp. B4113_201601]|nr:hypothetical protein B4113_2232 [Geobacillus sp. B4113_201601]
MARTSAAGRLFLRAFVRNEEPKAAAFFLADEGKNDIDIL